MSENLPEAPQGEFVLFRSEDGQTHVECRFESDTLWLSQAEIVNLYQVTPQAITQHVKAVYEEGNLYKIQLVSLSYKFDKKVIGRLIATRCITTSQ